MWFDLHMDEVHNKDELHFTPISLAARRVMERLFQEFYGSETKKNDGDTERERADDDVARFRIEGSRLASR